MKPGILIAVIAVLVVGVVVVIIGTLKGPSTSPATTKTETLGESSLTEIAKDIVSVSGKVLSINKNKNEIVVEALIAMKDITKEPIKHNVVVAINDKTIIKRVTYPSPEKLVGLTEPVEIKESVIKIGDLKIGEVLDVRSNINIYDSLKNNTPLTASTIDVSIYE